MFPEQLPCKLEKVQESPALFELLQRTARFLWKEWATEMELASFDNNGFALAGVCPHCGAKAAFVSIAGTYEERSDTGWPKRTVGAARCLGCNDYIVAALKAVAHGHSAIQWVYEFHYPIGKPNDDVAEEIPDVIKPDLKEAVRCRFVDAYNATVEMCRRALEASCIQLGADPDLVLSKMIDWVHAQGR